MKSAVAVATLLLVTAAASAQTVYRCGPQGRAYSDQPCKDGRAVDVGPAPTAEQRAQARDAADGDVRRAEALRRERLAREREAPRKAGFNAPPPPPFSDDSAAPRPRKHRATTRQRSSSVVR